LKNQENNSSEEGAERGPSAILSGKEKIAGSYIKVGTAVWVTN